MQKQPRESDSAQIEPQPPSPFQQEMAFVSNPEQMRRYAGQWVALAGDQVIANGPHPKEVLAEAKTHGYDDPVLHYFPLRDADTVFWGVWS